VRDAFIGALTELAENDPKIILITGDLGFGVLNDFAERFPDQFINAGIAEQNMTAIACGMAMEGYKVYTYSIANFPTLRCLEQIRNDVCYHDADVTVVSVGAGFSYGQLGMSHFATEDLAIMRALPSMRVVAPSDPWDAAALTKEMASLPGPKYLRIDKGAAGLSADDGSAKLGAIRTFGEGAVALVCIGAITSEAMTAAETLREDGIAVRVVVLNQLKPTQDADIVAALTGAEIIITVEEHNVIGGLGSLIADIALSHNLYPKTFQKIGLADIYPSVVGDQNYLRKSYAMAADDIVKAVRTAKM
jgi:transketolase